MAGKIGGTISGLFDGADECECMDNTFTCTLIRFESSFMIITHLLLYGVVDSDKESSWVRSSSWCDLCFLLRRVTQSVEWTGSGYLEQ